MLTYLARTGLIKSKDVCVAQEYNSSSEDWVSFRTVILQCKLTEHTEVVLQDSDDHQSPDDVRQCDHNCDEV